jgi:hypothetical protein
MWLYAGGNDWQVGADGFIGVGQGAFSRLGLVALIQYLWEAGLEPDDTCFTRFH